MSEDQIIERIKNLEVEIREIKEHLVDNSACKCKEPRYASVNEILTCTICMKPTKWEANPNG